LDDYANPLGYRLKWAYLLGLVLILLVPVFFNLYVSFNEFGFGAANYKFTFEWYKVVFRDSQLIEALGWTLFLALTTVVLTVPAGVLTAKLFKQTERKVIIVSLMLLPLFVPSDIFASALLVFFKNLNQAFELLSDSLGNKWFYGWFELGYMTAVIGLVIYTLPYVFIVTLITMGRYHPDQTEAARSCGASGWQAFWHIEFPQIRPGILSAASFVVILTLNEYTRTSMLKGGFDTFTTVLVSQMLNTGMSGESYAMGGIISSVAMLVIGGVIISTLFEPERREKLRAQKTHQTRPVDVER